ncbi:MAG: bile acid:sodium symporter, partial [Saprospiraceae bacterium]|nr:bile acid:sodium symporter [Saprospiraceae bacterium]
VSFGFADTAKDVFLVIILPAIAGLAFNHRYASFSATLQTPLKYINITLLALVFGIKFFADEQSGGSGLTTDEILLIFPYALGIHMLALVFSYFIARRFTLSIPQAITIGIEVGLQNTTLALLVTGSMIGNNDMTKPVLVYAMFSFFTTALFAFSVRYMNRSHN